MEWISVKDRLPEWDRTVIVCNAKKDRGRVWLSSAGSSKGFSEKYITHWMELPKPPKEDNNGR